MRYLKTLGLVVLVIAALPALCVIGLFVAGVALRPGFEPVDLSDPPHYLAFLGAWTDRDGSARCRIFFHRDLLLHADSVPPLRFGPSGSDMAVCAESIAFFRREGTWPDSFAWELEGTWANASRPDPENPNLFEVVYPPTEESETVTRYEADAAGGPPRAITHNAGSNAGTGIGILFFGGIGGILAWLTMLVWLTVDALRKRKSLAGDR